MARVPDTFLLILAGLWMYVSLVSRRSGYRCDKCGRAFQVPTTVNFFTASSVGKNPDGTYYSYKTLTCPHCGKAPRRASSSGSTLGRQGRRRDCSSRLFAAR